MSSSTLQQLSGFRANWARLNLVLSFWLTGCSFFVQLGSICIIVVFSCWPGLPLGWTDPGRPISADRLSQAGCHPVVEKSKPLCFRLRGTGKRPASRYSLAWVASSLGWECVTGMLQPVLFGIIVHFALYAHHLLAILQSEEVQGSAFGSVLAARLV